MLSDDFNKTGNLGSIWGKTFKSECVIVNLSHNVYDYVDVKLRESICWKHEKNE